MYIKILITNNKNTSTSKNKSLILFIKANSFSDVFHFLLPNFVITMSYNTETFKLHKFKLDKMYLNLLNGNLNCKSKCFLLGT